MGTSTGLKEHHAVGKRRPGRKAISGERSIGAREGSSRGKKLTSHYSMVVQWCPQDKCYVTTLPEFDNAHTHGETHSQAVEMGTELIASFLIWYEQDGKELPEPFFYAAPTV